MVGHSTYELMTTCFILQSLHGPMITAYALDGYEQLLKDELLNWNFLWTADKFCFDHILAKNVAAIEEILTLKNCKEVRAWKCTCFSMPVETALNLKIE